jgi:hypothetical protein
VQLGDLLGDLGVRVVGDVEGDELVDQREADLVAVPAGGCLRYSQ